MKPNVENLNFVWIGEKLIASADFLGQHIGVHCEYDTYQRCWRSDVFLLGETGLRRIEIHPSDLYANTRLGSVHRGMRRAKQSIAASTLSTVVPLDDRLRWSVRDDEVAHAASSFSVSQATLEEVGGVEA